MKEHHTNWDFGNRRNIFRGGTNYSESRQKRKKVIVILFFVLILIITFGIFQKTFYKQHESKSASQITQQMPAKKVLVPPLLKNQPLTKTALSIPIPYHPVKGILQQTIYLGTADHPTINGGIINAPGLAMNRDLPRTLPDEKKFSISPPASQLAISQTDRSFIKTDLHDHEMLQDNWATSEKVRKLLDTAAQEGKLNYVLQKTKTMGLPASLAVVPMVESNYQNSAVSPKGAAGAWQLMPATAKDYGLNKQDRFAFTSSTNAALKLLNNLHQQFGNWTLALAAYNAGSQRVKMALAKNPNATTMDELDLPTETKTYVKRMMDLNKTMIRMEEDNV